MKLIYNYPSTGARTFWSDVLLQEFHSPSKDYYTTYFLCPVSGHPSSGYTKSQIKKMVSQEFKKFSLRMGKPFVGKSGRLLWQAKITER